MRSLLLMFLVTACVGAAPEATKKTETAPVNEEMMKKDAAKAEPNALDKKPEDCDDAAKKPVEITPDSISLSGTTGCTLDESHP